MFIRYLGFSLLIFFPGLLHAQNEAQSCIAPTLDDGFFAPKQETFSHGEEITYTCNQGFKPLAKGWWAESTCQNGKWSPEPQCIDENSCSPLTIPNGKSTVTSKGWFNEEDTIRVTCDPGFEHRNRVATAKCINGKWTSVPVCERSNHTCNAPPKILHAVVVDQQYKELFEVDSEVQYQCEDKYTINGATNKISIYCLSGKWTEGPLCRSSNSSGARDEAIGLQKTEVRNCGRAPVVANGVPDIHQMYVRYECGTYYKRVGPERVVCYDNGEWSELPFCKAAFCTVDTDSMPELKPVGKLYFKIGETYRFECAPRREWWFAQYSQFRCKETGATFSRCCTWSQLNLKIC